MLKYDKNEARDDRVHTVALNERLNFPNCECAVAVELRVKYRYVDFIIDLR